MLVDFHDYLYMTLSRHLSDWPSSSLHKRCCDHAKQNLRELSVDPRSDEFGKNTALSLCRKRKSFKLVCCLIVWRASLFRTNMVSQLLQRENMHGHFNCSFLEHMWSDGGFEETVVDANSQLNYQSAPQKYRASSTMNHTINLLSMWTRINNSKGTSYFSHWTVPPYHWTTLNDIFGFLYNIKSQENDVFVQKCKDLQLALTYECHRDVDGTQLHRELIVLHSLFHSAKSLNVPLEVLKYISTNSLCENFPNLTVALRILHSLPVTSAAMMIIACYDDCGTGGVCVMSADGCPWRAVLGGL
ncbi:hypothetical protein PR048_026813 [Dryococelus australis]|uniref:Uncharacterized protein n=1 Tax=Dryococelus australis TaxID=614101 RepID=A0ABQ9GMC5_9NEOP|nr:hypothetical protein PR048_026813 [Dryococelus australis]